MMDLKTLYTVHDLAREFRINHQRLRRLLDSAGVKIIRIGNRSHVPLAEIEDKLPEVWRSVILVRLGMIDHD